MAGSARGLIDTVPLALDQGSMPTANNHVVLGSSTMAISKHIANIFMMLDFVPSEDDNRRVMAVLTYLDS
jgi:hypothetical protein